MRRMTLFLLICSTCFGQEVTGLVGSESNSKLNQQLVEQNSVRRAQVNTKDKDVVVFIGDRVIPQFVDGATWKTSLTLVNLENHSVNFQVLFFRDDGFDMFLPIVGQGSVRGMNITLNSAGSLSFETAGTASGLSQGWALISQTTNDSIGGLAVFRSGGSEAVVPIVNQFDNHFVMLFDNTAGFTTGAAIANPTSNTVVIPIYIRNELGQLIDTQTMSLPGYNHRAFGLSTQWPSTVGRRGAAEFLTSGFGVGALGLRFSSTAFTSFHVLSNFNWRVQ